MSGEDWDNISHTQYRISNILIGILNFSTEYYYGSYTFNPNFNAMVI